MDDNGEPKQQQPESGIGADIGKNPAPAQPATEQQLRDTEQKIEEQIEERMTGFERSMVRLTRYGLAVTVLTGIIFAGQLYEMITGGTQTDKLVGYARTQANSAGDQADAAQQFSDTAEDINGRMSDAVDQLEATTDNAKKALAASNKQSKAALDASIAASRSDQRAYVTIGRPDGTVAEILWPKDETGNAGLLVHFQNNGRLPAKFNWGSDSTFVAIVPSDPKVFKQSEIGKGYVELPTNHLFQPMYRAKTKDGKGVNWSGTIDIAGGSTYEGILWEVPKERMIQLINFDFRLTPSGRFEYCDGFGRRVCKNFHLSYARDPYNRFLLSFEDECGAMEMQVLHPMPDYEYLPVCSTERRELQGTLPGFPKPE
jgi:hypothetical protein